MSRDPTVPTYRIPIRRLLQAALYMILNRPRNLGDDFRYLLPELPAPPRISGTEHIPRVGPFVLVANHYERPGLWMGWSGMITARAIFEHTGGRLRWIAISEWKNFRIAGVRVPSPVTRFLFGRFFRTFGFVAMAPPGSPAQARADGVRAALQAIKAGDVIGILPEGTIGATPAMIKAQPGSGAFLLALQSRGARLIPTGLFEADDALNVRFGEAVDLSNANHGDRSRRDELAATAAMQAVARLLPPELRGVYRSHPP